MPAFLVELPVSGGKTLIGAQDSVVVFALDAADARAVAANAFDGDSNALWNSAQTVVTPIIEGLTLPANYEIEVTIFESAPGLGIAIPAKYKALGGTGNLALSGGTIGAAAGLLYVDDEVATVVGGTFTRAATFRCEGTGAVTAIDLMDPGEYTVLPTLDEMATTSSLIGDDALTIDGVAAPEDSFEVLLGQIVTQLNTDPEIANAAVDMSELLLGTRLLTIASIADGIGDSNVTVRIGAPVAGNVPGMLGAIVDGGVAAAVLTMALPTQAGIVMPTLTRALKSGH